MRYNWYKIGERIRNCRNEAGYSQEDLARQLDSILLRTSDDPILLSTSYDNDRPLSRGLVGRWENGQPIKKVEHIAALAEVFKCDMGYILCEYDTKHVKDVDINAMTGLPPIVSDRLIEYKQTDSLYLEVISLLLMDENLLRQIYDCVHSYYDTIAENRSAHARDLFLDSLESGKIYPLNQIAISKEKLEAIDLMLLYDRLKEFIGNTRTLIEAAEGSGIMPFGFHEILSSIRSASPAPRVAPNSAPICPSK